MLPGRDCFLLSSGSEAKGVERTGFLYPWLGASKIIELLAWRDIAGLSSSGSGMGCVGMRESGPLVWDRVLQGLTCGGRATSSSGSRIRGVGMTRKQTSS